MQWLWGKKKDRTDDAAAAAEDNQGTVDAGTDTSDGVDSGVNGTDGKQEDAGSKQPEYGALRTDGAASAGPEDNGQHGGTAPGDESNNGSGGVGAGDETAGSTDGSGQQAQVIIIERKGTGLNLLLGAALAFALVVGLAVYATNGVGYNRVNDLQAMQADVGKISTAVNEAVDKRRAAVDKLLYDSPSPSEEQLDKLGGWKLELKQTTVGGKQHVAITNVEAPSDRKDAGKDDDEDSSVKVVWEGDLASTAAVKFSLSSPVTAAFDGSPTDKLLTRSYSITGTLETAGKQAGGKPGANGSSSASNGSAANTAATEEPSVMALIDGDADGRVGDLKAVSVTDSGSKSDGDGGSKGRKPSMRPQKDDDDGLSGSLMRPRY